jgi:hypothetical protein
MHENMRMKDIIWIMKLIGIFPLSAMIDCKIEIAGKK